MGHRWIEVKLNKGGVHTPDCKDSSSIPSTSSNVKDEHSAMTDEYCSKLKPKASPPLPLPEKWQSQSEVANLFRSL